MNELSYTGLIKRITGFLGVATVASFASLPAAAQVNPRPNIFSEPRYDGVPGTEIAPGAAGQSQVNPSPSILNEPRYDGVPGTGSVPAVPTSTTPGLSQVNPNPQILNEPRYDGVPGTGSTSPVPTISQNATPAAAVSSLDREFFVMAAQSNNAEIQTSQLALQRSNNESVRQYAQRMIQEHTLANRQLAQLANQIGVSLPTDVDPLNRAIAERLAQLSGPEFDQAYMSAQATAHLRAVSLFQTESLHGQNQNLISYANQLLPAIQDHYQMASQMSPNYRAQDFRPGAGHDMNNNVR